MSERRNAGRDRTWTTPWSRVRTGAAATSRALAVRSAGSLANVRATTSSTLGGRSGRSSVTDGGGVYLAMDEPAVMGGIEGARDLVDDPRRSHGLQRALAMDRLP
jgi:hypothetical protein